MKRRTGAVALFATLCLPMSANADGIARSVDFPPLAEERLQRTSPAVRQN
jgi:hypothetical protein